MTDGNGSGPHGVRILVVEDEYLIAEHIALTLEDLGYHVVGPVGTIAGALAIVRGEQLDGALLDANLAGESSAEIAVALNAHTVPFVVVTGYGGLTLDAAILDGARRVMKPLSSALLAGALEETLAR